MKQLLVVTEDHKLVGESGSSSLRRNRGIQVSLSHKVIEMSELFSLESSLLISDR